MNILCHISSVAFRTTVVNTAARIESVCGGALFLCRNHYCCIYWCTDELKGNGRTLLFAVDFNLVCVHSYWSPVFFFCFVQLYSLCSFLNPPIRSDDRFPGRLRWAKPNQRVPRQGRPTGGRSWRRGSSSTRWPTAAACTGWPPSPSAACSSAGCPPPSTWSSCCRQRCPVVVF